LALSAEWRSLGESETVLIIDESNTVREAIAAEPAVLSRLLTNMGELGSWQGTIPADADKLDPASWGDLIIARAESGEVITMDPELFWDGIYTWFRSRGVDYDSPNQ
tara:strand:+ start:951 stop:1271 length:321 start_codon:yes stop_codon:yes gene_type:complete